MPVTVNLTVSFQDAIQQLYRDEEKTHSISGNDTVAVPTATATGVNDDTTTSRLRRRKQDASTTAAAWQTVFATFHDTKQNSLQKTNRSTMQWQPNRDKMDTFMLEAYRIADHIESLEQLLITSRRGYLARATQLGSGGGRSQIGGAMAMTEAERDEIDQQAKGIIRGCADRISRLEQAVKDAAPSMGVTLARQLLSTMGGAVDATMTEAAYEQQIRAHRGAVTWWLNKRLVDVSSLQREQQELRLRREIERQRSSLRTQSQWSTSNTNNNNNNNNKTTDATTDSASSPSLFEDERMVEKTLDLTPEQQQLLEDENRELAQSLESTLNQVKEAERAILEIAELQNQLMSHVAAQAKETEQLYEEAVATTDRVREGNLQLAEAGRRSADTRKWVLLFLILASLVLLFLDWYD
ncbi:hypothetical protein BDF19DRAFT_435239 [Syncephalis fuscata]|nr:hypothetical protein BDF19DRAFT_435239 [Syncephalis fuscata]